MPSVSRYTRQLPARWARIVPGKASKAAPVSSKRPAGVIGRSRFARGWHYHRGGSVTQSKARTVPRNAQRSRKPPLLEERAGVRGTAMCELIQINAALLRSLFLLLFPGAERVHVHRNTKGLVLTTHEHATNRAHVAVVAPPA